ncbi:MAG: transglycosylase SLT domain-containing protein [Myxococcales bacterium]|nr:transglycosylase SLT domain-containing protein [Myxococcales bacterium]
MVSALLAVAGACYGLPAAHAGSAVRQTSAHKAPGAKPCGPIDEGVVGAEAPAKAVGHAASSGPMNRGSAPAKVVGDPQQVDTSCLAQTICQLKEKMRWHRPGWDEPFCNEIAEGFLRTADEFGLNPALLLAVAINESNLDEKAVATSVRGETVYARDGGLMGIRCLMDPKGMCTNGNVRGLPWTSIMNPLDNIEMGAKELAHYRNGAGIERVEERRRGRDGKVTVVVRNTRCRHKTHAYWAHYNHGPVYLSQGYARHYPHRVAVLYYALVKAMGMGMPRELSHGRITIHDRGSRERTADRPVETRYKELVEIIDASAGPSCRNLASLVH